MKKDDVIKLLKLEPLQMEGGYFRQTYKSDLNIPKTAMPAAFKAPAYTASTSIYYMLSGSQTSTMHALPADETWHFYTADSPSTSILLLTIAQDGAFQKISLGADLKRGQVPQHTIKAGHWMGAFIVADNPDSAWTLTGATVAPSFEYADFVKGDAKELSKLCPACAKLIEKIG